MKNDCPGCEERDRRIRELEEIICYKESKVTMAEHLGEIENEIFSRFPYGTLPGDKE